MVQPWFTVVMDHGLYQGQGLSLILLIKDFARTRILIFGQIIHAKGQPKQALVIHLNGDLDLLHTMIRGMGKRSPAAGRLSFTMNGKKCKLPSTTMLSLQTGHALR